MRICPPSNPGSSDGKEHAAPVPSSATASIILVSKRLKQGAGVKWELECVSNAGFPLLGVFVEKCDRSAVPEQLEDSSVIEWNWGEIAGFIASLEKPARHVAR